MNMKLQAYKTWGNHVAQLADPVPNGYVLQTIDLAQNMKPLIEELGAE